jgi:hypothetical protein
MKRLAIAFPIFPLCLSLAINDPIPLPIATPIAISKPSSQQRYVSFPAAGVKLLQPLGFDVADRFDGFGQASTTSSVMVVTIPANLKTVTSGFNAAKLQSRGMKLLSKENVKVDGRQGILLKVSQTAYGIEFIKWMLAVGTDTDTKIVTATFPQEREAKLSSPLKTSLLSVKIDETAAHTIGSSAGYTLTASNKLKLTREFGKTLLYTKDGVVPAKSVADPLFVVSPSFSQVEIDNRQQFALQRLSQTTNTKIGKVTATNPIEIDGSSGYEIIAQAQDSSSGTPLVVYQVMLFEANSYFLMQGLVGEQLSDEYLPVFQSMARSFKRQKKLSKIRVGRN